MITSERECQPAENQQREFDRVSVNGYARGAQRKYHEPPNYRETIEKGSRQAIRENHLPVVYKVEGGARSRRYYGHDGRNFSDFAIRQI